MIKIVNDRHLIEAMQADEEIKTLRQQLLLAIAKYRYTYNFTWFDRPIIQLPDDILVLQELILSIKPDLIIETGVAHGGSLVFSASMLELLGQGEVIGIDIDIRPENRLAIEQHPLAHRIHLIQGSSTDKCVSEQVVVQAKDKRTIMVLLDSDHTHQHVLRELELYSPLVTLGSYLIVFDTAIEDMPEGSYPNRSWSKTDNPKTAVWEFLKTNQRFQIDSELEAKLLVTVAPSGYLKCIAG